MGWIIDYIRSCFCKHQWKLLEEAHVYESSYSNMPLGTRRTYICEKCLKRKIIKTW